MSTNTTKQTKKPLPPVYNAHWMDETRAKDRQAHTLPELPLILPVRQGQSPPIYARYYIDWTYERGWIVSKQLPEHKQIVVPLADCIERTTSLVLAFTFWGMAIQERCKPVEIHPICKEDRIGFGWGERPHPDNQEATKIAHTYERVQEPIPMPSLWRRTLQWLGIG
jgi:hypothetical protein